MIPSPLDAEPSDPSLYRGRRTSVCTAYARLVRSAKMQPRTFASVEDFVRFGFLPMRMRAWSPTCKCPEPAASICPPARPRRASSAGHLCHRARHAGDARLARNGSARPAYFRKPVDDQALLDAIAWALSGQHAADLRHPCTVDLRPDCRSQTDDPTDRQTPLALQP